MKEMNLPETQLHSWQPRHSSAQLKRKIFSTRVGARSFGWFWGPLAPVTACALVTFMALHSGNEISGGARMGVSTGMIASNSSVNAYAGDFRAGENNLNGFTFEWTNRSISNSSIGFTPFAKSTN